MNAFTRVITAATAVAALSAGLSSAQAATSIQLFFPVPVQGKLANEMQNVVKRFNDAHKDIEVTPVYTGSYDDTNLKTRAAIKAGKPPAVVIMSANFILEYVINGEVQPFDDLARADGQTPAQFMDNFWPALHANATIDGKIYGVPFHNSTPLLYYSVDAFKEAGLNPDQPPATWEDWIKAAQALTKREGNTVKRWGFMMPATYDYLGWITSALNMSNGGQYYNTVYGGEVYYNTPTMLGAVTLLHDMVHRHKVMPEGVNDANATTNAFFAGNLGMMVLSTGSLSFVRENMKHPYKVAFLPRNVRNAVPIGGASLMMPKGLDEAQKKAAWTLVKWLTSPKQSGEWSRFTGYFAPNRHAYDLPEMKDFIAKNPDAKVALDQLAYAGPWFATYNTVGVRKALEDQVQAVLSGKQQPQAAVEAAQKAADALLRPYVEQTALKLVGKTN
ncbi:ABC transporter substrate-binding protein [Ferrovibrio sp.]|uniref:ABC transporter substrate-binding protein n=1 Tax=Ferrovibrio sp. TaxID=1917215 RepID=UPI00311D58DE